MIRCKESCLDLEKQLQEFVRKQLYTLYQLILRSPRLSNFLRGKLTNLPGLFACVHQLLSKHEIESAAVTTHADRSQAPTTNISADSKYRSLSSRANDIVGFLRSQALPRSTKQCITAEDVVNVADELQSLRDRLRKQSESEKKLIAWVSPLPPEKTGIAHYSEEVIGLLSAHFDVVPVCPSRKLNRLQPYSMILEYAELFLFWRAFDLIVYNLGNSDYHDDIVRLAKLIPGVVVLHDTHIGHSLYSLCEGDPDAILLAAIEQGGGAPLARYKTIRELIDQYPLSAFAMTEAISVIVHSNYAKNVLMREHPLLEDANVSVVPMVRQSFRQKILKTDARIRLAIANDAYVIGSFGHINAMKGAEQLIEALAEFNSNYSDSVAKLYFVGPCNDDELMKMLERKIKKLNIENSVVFQGFVTVEQYQLYLSSVDVAIQLRLESKGETSAAVMDCLANAVPTIVNDIGSFSEIEEGAALKIPELFTVRDLYSALEELHDEGRRREYADSAAAFSAKTHSPGSVIPDLHAVLNSQIRLKPERCVIDYACWVKTQTGNLPSLDAMDPVAQILATKFPGRVFKRRLFVDVTAIDHQDLKTGIQRVVRALMTGLLPVAENDFAVIPVKLDMDNGGRWVYRLAPAFTASLAASDDLRLSVANMASSLIDFRPQDVLFCLDFTGARLVAAEQSGLYARLRSNGVSLLVAVYDLLPINYPEVFPPGADADHIAWLMAIADFDAALCISGTVAADLKAWLQTNAPATSLCREDAVKFWPLGSDIETALAAKDSIEVLDELNSFLTRKNLVIMVGTIEPRKAYQEVLEAMELLWDRGSDLSLVIVGREGWKHLPDEKRRNIPTIVEKLGRLSEETDRLLWLSDASDDVLTLAYKNADLLLCASVGEGFGLPVTEGLRYGKHVLARDIPVFREVGGEGVSYAAWHGAEALASAILMAIEQKSRATTLHYSSPITWQTSAEEALKIIKECNKNFAANIVQREAAYNVS